LHTAEVLVASSLYSGLPFRSLLSLGGGTGNAPLISLRPSLITDHHFVSTLNDLAKAKVGEGASWVRWSRFPVLVSMTER
jgi:hypothetical protein